MFSPLVIKQAKDITRTFGRGFYRASYLFPRGIRVATWILYAFVRIPDEMVDSQIDLQVARRDLATWITDWESVISLTNTLSVHPILRATKILHEKYHIPYEYSTAFLHAMHQDLTVTRYETYDDLQAYMYGSASVVGIMMSYIIGHDEGALPHAQSLGEAFQLINFLRDAQEDYKVRGRIYIPRKDLERFEVTEAHIRDGINDEKWHQLMRFEINRARTLLANGIEGIPLLHPLGQRAVYASALMYGEILGEFERLNYNTFEKRVVISPYKKTMLLLKALWKKNQL